MEIDISMNKEPYIKEITKDKIINITGESGSGKTYYTKEYIDNDEYIVIDTDEVFSKNKKATGINSEVSNYFINKYKDKIPSLFDNFDKIYLDLLEYFQDSEKTLVIDSAQFRNMVDLKNLKGTIIILRTSIDECYKRCINRFKENNKNATKDDIEIYSNKKKGIYEWYKYLNEFLIAVDKLWIKINKKYLSKEQLKLFDQAPIDFAFDDPF